MMANEEAHFSSMSLAALASERRGPSGRITRGQAGTCVCLARLIGVWDFHRHHAAWTKLPHSTRKQTSLWEQKKKKSTKADQASL